ncbi:MAG: N-acetyl-gamma-glutamyl-phosphate reductase [Clostridiales bacterium]|nr:N-acetyl-gamma-glutamyl-phosphate reductase [Clostridiales bacterium]
MNIGIYGATGYGGMQLISLLKKHPHVNLLFLTSNRYSGKKFSELYSKFAGEVDDLLIDELSSYNLIGDTDLVFLALPHGVSMHHVKKLKSLNPNLKIIDLSGDFRIQNPDIYEKWYGSDHVLKESIAEFAYGLPEINRERIINSKYVANPGCFPTSMLLALYPLIEEDMIEGKIISDSKTGVSGAGRKENQNFLFTEIQDNTYAYNTGVHRHSPEVVETLKDLTGNEIQFLFSPHIVPSSRGIFTTIYLNLKKSFTIADVDRIFHQYYDKEYFIKLIDFIPSTKDVNRSNNVFIHYRFDDNSNTLIVYSAIDNLMKGASSQAIQNMNILFGFEEQLGIDFNLYYL